MRPTLICLIFLLVIQCMTSAWANESSTTKDYYVLGFPAYEGCGAYYEYRAPKNAMSPRKALAIYQIISFVYGDAGLVGQVDPDQFGLKSLPNDIAISRWNKVQFLLPYSVDEYITALHSKVENNNPYNLRSYFPTELDVDDYKIARDIGELRLKDLSKYLDSHDVHYGSNSPLQQKLLDKLQVLLDKYHVEKVELKDDVDCE